MHEYIPLTEVETGLALESLRTRGRACFSSQPAIEPAPVWPGDNAAVIIQTAPAAALECRVLTWGFDPPESVAPSKLVFNARWEKLCDQRRQGYGFWASARPCLVPARRFWEPSPQGDVPFGVQGLPVFLMAGVFLHGRFATVTVPASPDVLPIHPRMPLVLARGDSSAWLAGEMLDPARSPALQRLSKG